MERGGSLDEDLVLTLMEFDDALQGFTQGPCNSEEHLRMLKEQQTSLKSSGGDSQSKMATPHSDLNYLKRDPVKRSEENLTHSFPNTSQQPKAKLGDTRELESFISDLDKVLHDF